MKSQFLGVALKHLLAFSAAIIVSAIVVPAHGQLQVTEFMYDTFATNDSIYEWVEVRNTGATDIDLNGAYMDDLLGAPIPNPGNPSISTSFSGANRSARGRRGGDLRCVPKHWFTCQLQ